MSQTSLLCGGQEFNASTVGAGAYYAPLTGDLPARSVQTVEAGSQVSYVGGATIVSWHLSVLSNSQTQPCSFTIRKNSATTTSVIAIPAATTGDLYSFVPLAVNGSDIMNLMYTSAPSGSSGITVRGYTYRYDTLAQAKKFLESGSNNGGVQVSNAALTVYSTFSGQGIPRTTEALAQCPVAEAGTVDNFQIGVPTNGHVTASTFTVRKNGVSGTCTISVPASTTGRFQDTSHTDTFAAGDLINYIGTTTSGSGILSVGVAAIRWTGAVTNQSMSLIENTGAFTGGWALGGTSVGGKSLALTAGTLSGLRAQVISNSAAASNVVTSTINSVPGNVTITIPAATTGVFSDTTHSDVVATGASMAFSQASVSNTYAMNHSSLFLANPTPFIPEQRPLRFRYRN